MATFKELTGLTADAPAERPLSTLHGTGSDTRLAEGNEAARLEEEHGFVSNVATAWEGNIVPNFYDEVQRKWDHAPDRDFDPTAWVTENAETIPGDAAKFGTTRSTGEAEELRADMLRAQANQAQLSAQGFGGVAAQILAGMADPAELAVGIATGGTSKGLSVGRRLVKGAVQGAAGGTAAGALAVAVDPMADLDQIVMSTLTGALLGGAIGTATNRASAATKRDFQTEVADLPALDDVDAPVLPVTSNAPDDVEPLLDGDNTQSLGAASTQAGPDLSGMNPDQKKVFDRSMATIRSNNLGVRFEDTDLANIDTKAGRTAKRFSDALANDLWTPLKTDFDRLTTSGSRVEQALGYDLLESAEGRVRNNRSAAMLQETYYNRMASHSMIEVDEGYHGWAKDRDIGMMDKQRSTVRDEFDREVILELEARYNDGVPASTDPHVLRAADGIDKNMSEAIDIGNGRTGEHAVDGFDRIDKKSGYFRHKWTGEKIKAVIANTSKARVEKAVANAIRTGSPDMTDAMSEIVGKAIVRRAVSRSEGVDMNMLSTMDSDASDFLREMLKDSGHSDDTIDSLIEAIKGKKEEQGTMGATKRRTQIDLRSSSDGINLIDLVDTNVNRSLQHYNREVAGRSALARKGITNAAHKKDVVEAALSERAAKGLSAGPADRKYIENIFTMFDAGPIGDGVDPMVSRLKRLTNLALLNQMGITQLGETGAQAAAVGMQLWGRHSKELTHLMVTQGKDGPIINELKPFMGEIGKDHMLFRDELMMDELAMAKEAHAWMATIDNGLAKAQRAQGFLSGFYHVKGMQQKIAVSSQADKVMQRLRDGVDEAQLNDIGIPQKLKKYIDDGTVEFMPDGVVNRLNIDRWDATDAEDFVLALNRHTNQVVQKAMAGEESMWMHSTMGSVFTHLKSFPLNAMRKQSIRTGATSNPLLIATLFQGLATAGLAYQAKQIINGRTQNIGGKEAIRGAMAMSNMTGWVPMLADPGFAMLGMNDLKFSQYGRHDISTNVFGSPAMLPTLNKLAQVPGLFNPANQMTKNERLRIMQAAPLLGNWYGVSYVLNAMKE